MDLKLDNDHDLFVTNQDLTLTTLDNEVVQDLSIRLQFILNEWFLDNSVGVPYPQTIFEKGTNLNNNLQSSSDLAWYLHQYAGLKYSAKDYLIDTQSKISVGLILQSARHTVISVSVTIRKLI